MCSQFPYGFNVQHIDSTRSASIYNTGELHFCICPAELIARAYLHMPHIPYSQGISAYAAEIISTVKNSSSLQVARWQQGGIILICHGLRERPPKERTEVDRTMGSSPTLSFTNNNESKEDNGTQYQSQRGWVSLHQVDY